MISGENWYVMWLEETWMYLRKRIEKRGKRLFGFFKKGRLLLLNLPVYIVEGEITLYEQVFQRKRRIGNRILSS